MQENNHSKKVSVVGLGLMGSTLARLLIKQDYQVTVWNRTAEKAKTLVEKGAIYNSNVSEVVETSDFIVVCVYDYKATGEIFNNDAVQNTLAGKTIIQLTTGIPQEARESEEWAHRYGASYLDGAIMAAPVQMGRADTIILASGQTDAFQQSEEILKTFGGKVNYLGEKIGSASAMDLALLSYAYGATLGFFHGVRIGEVEGFRAVISARSSVTFPIPSENWSNTKASLSSRKTTPPPKAPSASPSRRSNAFSKPPAIQASARSFRNLLQASSDKLKTPDMRMKNSPH